MHLELAWYLSWLVSAGYRTPCSIHSLWDPTEDPTEQCWPVPTLWLGYGLSEHVVSELQGEEVLVTFCHMLT